MVVVNVVATHAVATHAVAILAVVTRAATVIIADAIHSLIHARALHFLIHAVAAEWHTADTVMVDAVDAMADGRRLNALLI